MAPSTTMRVADVVSDFEVHAALRFCVFSYEARKPNEPSGQFKSRVLATFASILSALGVKNATDQTPFIEFDGDKVRNIIASIGTVVYICVTGSNTIRDHVTNCVIASTRIVEGQDGDAPAGFNVEARELCIARVAREILRDSAVSKVIFCGHSRGGSVAHVAHYSLLINPNYDNIPSHKLASIAFGSTPFLKSQNPIVAGDRFVTYYTDDDIVPALFSATTAIVDRVQSMKGSWVQLAQWATGINLDNVRATAAEHTNLVLSEYAYFGNWIHLHKTFYVFGIAFGTPIEEASDPVAYFRSDGFKARLDAMTSIKAMKDAHGIQTAYEHFFTRSVAAPDMDAQLSRRVAHVMLGAALEYKVPPEMQNDALCVRLHRAITAAVVLRSFGDDSVRANLKDFGDALEAYLIVGRRLSREENPTKTKVDTKIEAEEKKSVRNDMQPWRDLLQRIHAIAPADTPTAHINAVRTFNEANIGQMLPDVVLLVTYLLAQDFVQMQKSPVMWPYWLGAAVAAVAAGYVIASTGGAAEVAGTLGASAISAATVRLSSMKAMPTKSFAQLVASLLALVAGGYGSYRITWSALAIHVKTESFRSASIAYADQLKKMASTMGLLCAPSATRHLEAQLAAFKVPDDAEQKPLFDAFSKVLTTLVRLEEACKAIVFIVLNGNQYVGKSWFIRAINSTQQEARESTTQPSFLRYAPMADDPNRKVYLIDIPGNNTLNEVQAQYTAGLHGVGTIGISLLQFDKTPHVLPAAAIRSAFNGCDRVLLCLNKVAGMGLDLALELEEGESPVIPPIVDKWRQQFALDGIDFSSGKFHLMATEMHGSSNAETPRMTDIRREQLQGEIKYNLQAVRVNGGQTKDDVIDWIREQVDEIIRSRSLSSSS